MSSRFGVTGNAPAEKAACSKLVGCRHAYYHTVSAFTVRAAPTAVSTHTFGYNVSEDRIWISCAAWPQRVWITRRLARAMVQGGGGRARIGGRHVARGRRGRHRARRRAPPTRQMPVQEAPNANVTGAAIADLSHPRSTAVNTAK